MSTPYNFNNFTDAIQKRKVLETKMANRLGRATYEEIQNHVANILTEDKSDYAAFLITIRDQVVKQGKANIRSQLLDIKDKVKNKQLLTQTDVDLLQSYNLKCRRGMNLQGRTFSHLDGCDFTDANIDDITVNGSITNSILGKKNGTIKGMKISGDIDNNEVAGDMRGNAVAGNIYRNKVAGDMRDNVVAGDMRDNVVAGDMRDNVVAGDMVRNTCKKALSNFYGGTSDLTDPSNKLLTPEEKKRYSEK